jgi:predicted XRE-type DNA-binding protein
MPNVKRSNKPGHVTEGDIFDDLCLSPQEALEAKVKSDIWRDLITHINKRELDQATLKRLLKLHQPDVSNLLRGKISKFSTSKLITLAIRLDLHVRVQLTAPKTAKGVLPGMAATKASRMSQEGSERVHA